MTMICIWQPLKCMNRSVTCVRNTCRIFQAKFKDETFDEFPCCIVKFITVWKILTIRSSDRREFQVLTFVCRIGGRIEQRKSFSILANGNWQSTTERRRHFVDVVSTLQSTAYISNLRYSEERLPRPKV